jgi:hypothetical protein
MPGSLPIQVGHGDEFQNITQSEIGDSTAQLEATAKHRRGPSQGASLHHEKFMEKWHQISACELN